MTTIFDHVKRLHEEGLYSNLVQVLNLILVQPQPVLETLTPQQEYQSTVYYGNALYHNKDYRKAERVYHKALDLRKMATKSKKKTQPTTAFELTSEIEVKYQIYLCNRKLQQYSNASLILESIASRQRSPRINMALAELYQREKNDANAIICYKEILKENPLAFKVIINLMKLGVKANEVINVVVCSLSNIPNLEWVSGWIKAQYYLYSYEVNQGVTAFKQLQSRSFLKDNPEIVTCYAEALYYNGDYKKAIPVFKKAYVMDPLLLKGMDVYAACLAKENHVKELENLANRLVQRCESGERYAEPWLVLSYYAFLTNKKESKALYFAQKACLLSNNSTEAMLLKGRIMAEARSHMEAVNYFLEAFNAAPYRFEALKALTEAYLADNRKQQAQAMATQALKHFGHTPRTLTLFASVLLVDPDKGSNKKNVKSYLEKAVRLEKSFLPAVYSLVNIYMEEKNVDKAIEILTKALEFESNNKLHRMLGDCFTEKNEHEKALHHHNIASKLEVNYRSVTEASQRLEQQSTSRSGNVEATLELEVDDIQESENEIDESETDVVWSDNDF